MRCGARRLGVIRIVLRTIAAAVAPAVGSIRRVAATSLAEASRVHPCKSRSRLSATTSIGASSKCWYRRASGDRSGAGAFDLQQTRDLLAFFADRLKVQLREQGARHDLVDAVFALEGQDDLLLIVRRVEALGKFLDTDDGKNLLAGTKRAANILRIEEKKDKQELHRRARCQALPAAGRKGAGRGHRRRQEGSRRRRRQGGFRRRHDARWRSCARTSMPSSTRSRSMSTTRRLRENRLKLLNEIREATRAVADFSKIEG